MNFLGYSSMVSFNLIGTLILELLTAYILKVRGKENFRLLFDVNCISNPIVVTLLYLMIRLWGYGLLTKGLLFLLEIAVVFVEGRFYKRLKSAPVGPYKLSVILNGISYGSGVLLELIRKI